MDLSQVKLTKKEWASVEIPVSDKEKEILALIQRGYHDIHIRYNKNQSMLSILKIDPTPEIEWYLYDKYFRARIQEILALGKWESIMYETTGGGATTAGGKIKPPKKADLIRMAHMESNIQKYQDHMVEFQQLEFMKHMAHPTTPQRMYFLYTLLQTQRATIGGMNSHVVRFVRAVLDHVVSVVPRLTRTVFMHSHEILEKNPNVLKYQDMTLYDHQKQLFQCFRVREEGAISCPRLVFYTAPTGTGKTLSPLGLAEGYRIIYICAARHVGLALAKSAITMEKAVAFAFGCETASDIRLHYYAAAEYTKNRKTGGIWKVDNSDGRKVEIMICDAASYIVAMLYMLNFNEENRLIMYWDEPTIGLDVLEHPLHDTIRRLWRENKISQVVLSSATLPRADLLEDVMDGFRQRFDGAEIHHIASHEFHKTVAILDGAGKCVLPHTLFESYEELRLSEAHCREYPCLLRYLDLQEIVRFVEYAESLRALPDELLVETYFRNVTGLTMMSIKEYYLEVLKRMDPIQWPFLYTHLKDTQTPKWMVPPLAKIRSEEVYRKPARDPGAGHGEALRRMQSVASIHPLALSAPYGHGVTTTSGIRLTTEDAHTLTDGPTIFLTEDVAKIGKFYIQQTKIPSLVLDGIMAKIGANNQLQKKMDVLLRNLDDALGKEADKDKKMEKEAFKPEVKKTMAAIEALRGQMAAVTLDAVYVPNSRPHQAIWVPGGKAVENAFVPFIGETTVRDIMELGVENDLKVLLLLGIGVFLDRSETTPALVAYLEIMKRLSEEQRLFLILASSDYIYGTNYQMCHAFLGKDLRNMSQQKIIQAMGRVGRGNLQQEYTVRFRDETLLRKLFRPMAPEENVEAHNLCRLCSGDV